MEHPYTYFFSDQKRKQQPLHKNIYMNRQCGGNIVHNPTSPRLPQYPLIGGVQSFLRLAEIGDDGDRRLAVGDGRPEVEEGVEAAAKTAAEEDGAALRGDEERLGVDDRGAGKRKVEVETGVNLERKQKDHLIDWKWKTASI